MNKWKEVKSILDNVSEDLEVYYQPPANYKINYPAIIFNKTGGGYDFADDEVYSKQMEYDVKVIYKNPNEDFEESMSNIQFCSPTRSFVSNGLYHDVYKLYI